MDAPTRDALPAMPAVPDEGPIPQQVLDAIGAVDRRTFLRLSAQTTREDQALALLAAWTVGRAHEADPHMCELAVTTVSEIHRLTYEARQRERAARATTEPAPPSRPASDSRPARHTYAGPLEEPAACTQ